MEQDDIRQKYLDLKLKYEKLEAGLKKKQVIISLLRLAVFVSGTIVSVIIIIKSPATGIFLLVVTGSIFLSLVRKSTDYSDRIEIAGNLVKINSDEMKALDGDCSHFDGGIDLIDPGHDFSNDIDLFGKDSLFGYLNRTVTFSGRMQLAEWLSDPFPFSNEMTERQESVAELSEKIEWRQRFIAYGHGGQSGSDQVSFENWLSDKYTSLPSAVTVYLSYILPVILITSIVFAVFGFIPSGVPVIFFFFNLMLTVSFVRTSNRIHAIVSKKQDYLSSVGRLTGCFENEKFDSDLLNGIQKKLYSGNSSAAGKIKELGKIVQAFDSRLNLFVGIILNGLLLWDFHCIRKLEKWKAGAASEFPVWMSLLGKIDGLSSFANFKYNNPDYCFPVLNNSEQVINASAMGHPLISRKVRVYNDFTIGKRGIVYIITGANMSGKSTFLRTVAVNLILAMNGAPVCAGAMKFIPVKLFTSMRTTDSLSHNESYFYAELKRLKNLKERLETDNGIFFILDEILKGTNSNDKSLGSKLFLRKMIMAGGTGLIATHDISLGEMEAEFPENVVNKCFEIEIEEDAIRFDYILRDGITRKMNAALLMRRMGIV